MNESDDPTRIPNDLFVSATLSPLQTSLGVPCAIQFAWMGSRVTLLAAASRVKISMRPSSQRARLSGLDAHDVIYSHMSIQ